LRIEVSSTSCKTGVSREYGFRQLVAPECRAAAERKMRAACGSLMYRAILRQSAPSTVHRIWQAFGLQPHRVETFKLSSDPLFVEKVRDIVGLYLSPPERAVVLCVDEKSQVQALDRTQPLLPMRPAKSNGARMITSGTERHLCSRHST
jgi:hypothetical protein